MTEGARRTPLVPLRALRHCAELIQTGPFGSQLHASDYVDGGVPVVNPTNLFESGIRPDRESSVSQAVAARLNVHALRSGDVVMARRGELGRSSVIVDEDLPALCGTGSLVVRLKREEASAKFVQYWLMTSFCRQWMADAAVGATMANIGASTVSKLPIPTWSTSQQRRIADFLDARCAAIDAAIEKKERMLEAAEEQYREANRSTIESLQKSASMVKLGRFVTPIAMEECHLPRVSRGDLVIALTGEGKTRGKVAVIDCNEATISQHLAYIRPDKTRLDPEFLQLQLDTRYEHFRFDTAGTGGTRAALTCEYVKSIRILVPASFAEQRRIAETLGSNFKCSSRLTTALTRSIAALREYRTALITAAVTGKLELPAAPTAAVSP
jgi:restriction endonuclease S subunit